MRSLFRCNYLSRIYSDQKIYIVHLINERRFFVRFCRILAKKKISVINN